MLNEVVIYGIGKVQKDFEYIFDQMTVKKYIVDENHSEIKIWHNKPVFSIDNLDDEEKGYVIICDYDWKEKKSKLDRKGWKRGTDYYLADDFFGELDISLEELANGRFIYVWGTGYRANEYLSDSLFCSITVGCIDNDINKKGSLHYGKKVYHPTEITEWENKFVVIATDAFWEIGKQLEIRGLRKNADYIWSRHLVNKPSKMLLKTIYDTAQYDLICDTMFGTYEIESTGEVACCCTTFLDERVGNLVDQDFKDIWWSNTHKILCLSAANKTYSFCKSDMCPVLMEKSRKEYKNSYTETARYKTIEQSPKVILISIDSSCNLYCESCRECVKILTGSAKEKAAIMADKLLNTGNLSDAEFIVMAGNGEVFLSDIYERIWSSEQTKHTKRFRLLSNGTIFTPQRWNKFADNRTSEVVVTFSIDAATEKTYREVRRGGNFSQLMDNMCFASELRKQGKLGYFQISFVVQRKNYKEMPLFVELGKKLGVDKVFFTRILNWGTYREDEFSKVSMTDADGHANTELQEILELPIMQESIVDLGTINSKRNEQEYNYIYNYYLWEIDRYLNKEQ